MDPDPGMGEPRAPQRKDREVLEHIVNELELLKDYAKNGDGEPITRCMPFALALLVDGVAARAYLPGLTAHGRRNHGLMPTFLHGKDGRIRGTRLATKL
jgi:hypothetical protein